MDYKKTCQLKGGGEEEEEKWLFILGKYINSDQFSFSAN